MCTLIDPSNHDQSRFMSLVDEHVRSTWMNIDRLKGKVVLVTGAGSGLGEATAHAFASVGWLFCGVY